MHTFSYICLVLETKPYKMRKLFFTTIIAIMTLAYACDRKTIFELTSDPVISAPYEGGNYTITYNLESKDEDVVKAMTNNQDMITSIDTQTDGYVYVTVSKNSTAETREASILISYGNLCLNVDVEQEANTEGPEEPEGPEVPEVPEVPEEPEIPENTTINIEADTFIGKYYGDDIVDGLGHYWVILSDGGLVDNSLLPNSEFFRLDLLGPMIYDENNAKIPDGFYVFDLNNSFEEYSILNIGNSDYSYVDENGEAWAYPFTKASLIVEGDMLTLTATANGKDYFVFFEGDYQLSYNPVSDIISTLKSDYVIDLDGYTGTVKCYGDYWKCGYCDWGIEFNYGIEDGDFLVLDFMTDNKTDGSSGFEGTYRSAGFKDDDPSQPAWSPYTFVPGFRLDGAYMMGSIMQEYVNGKGINEAPIFDGELSITSNNDGTHTIVIDATDDATPAHKITLNWTGKLEMSSKKDSKIKLQKINNF